MNLIIVRKDMNKIKIKTKDKILNPTRNTCLKRKADKVMEKEKKQIKIIE